MRLHLKADGIRVSNDSNDTHSKTLRRDIAAISDTAGSVTHVCTESHVMGILTFPYAFQKAPFRDDNIMLRWCCCARGHDCTGVNLGCDIAFDGASRDLIVGARCEAKAIV